MTNRKTVINLGVILLTSFLLASSGLPQDKEVALTVYNDNLALVKDVRTLRLTKGISEYKFQDVAAQIDPTSVYFTSQTAPDKVAILEQNYEFDLVNSSKILQKYVDQEITLEGKQGTLYSGTLLSGSGKDVILRSADESIKIVSMATIENMAFPKLPDGLITRPTLIWSLDCQKAGDHKIEVGYLTTGIHWHAEYVGVANEDDSELELGGWVSIDNKSGAAYEHAKLRLVAGDVQRARREIVPVFSPMERALKAAPDQFEEKAFFEYHLYTLQRPTTVANNQIKQVSLFPASKTQVDKKFTYDGAVDGKKVRVSLEFKNEKAEGLGFPLPKGKVRVYKQDQDESLIFIGEDFIDHTPVDEKVEVYVGNAFDIVGERTQKNRRSIGQRTWEETWQIQLRNRKVESVTVTVIEHLNLNWEILRSSHPYNQKDAQTVEFMVTIAEGAELEIEYVVRYNQ